MKKYAVFNENGYKIAGYLEGYPNIPAEAIEITDEEETLYNNGYIRIAGEAVLAPEILPTLDEVKEEKCNELNAIRDEKDLEPVTTDKGTFDFDENAQKSIDLALKVAQIQGIAETNWTLYDNTEVTVTVDDLNNVILTAGIRKITNHAHCVELKNQVKNSTTIEEIELIEW